MSAGRRIIDALKEAVAGDFASVTVEGKTFVRRDWQPIDTAPKDGTEVLLLVPRRPGRTQVCQGSNITGNQWWSSWVGVVRPTHWMPLPDAPPSASMETGRE